MSALAPRLRHGRGGQLLPSSTGRETGSGNRDFLRVVPPRTFVKVVLSDRATEAEWKQVVELVRHAPHPLHLYLQPAMPIGKVKPIPAARALRFEAIARRAVKEVFVRPQWHRLWNLP